MAERALGKEDSRVDEFFWHTITRLWERSWEGKCGPSLTETWRKQSLGCCLPIKISQHLTLSIHSHGTWFGHRTKEWQMDFCNVPAGTSGLSSTSVIPEEWMQTLSLLCWKKKNERCVCPLTEWVMLTPDTVQAKPNTTLISLATEAAQFWCTSDEERTATDQRGCSVCCLILFHIATHLGTPADAGTRGTKRI